MLLILGCLLTFEVNAVKGIVTRVSVNSNGDQADFHSRYATLNSDGRIVAFHSSASNLSPGDFPGQDIYIHDRLTGMTTKVSVDSTGVAANSHSYWPSLSTDGNIVVFQSSADNLIVSDTNNKSDIFVHNRLTGNTIRTSVHSAGNEGNNASDHPDISADGRFVTFHSAASNLVPGDTNVSTDIFVHDIQTALTTRVSVISTGDEANDNSFYPVISADGQIVAFNSAATNLVADDNNEFADIFVHNRLTGKTTRLSKNNAGDEANGDSMYPALSSDGRIVAFYSSATNLVPDDNNKIGDIFVHDRQTGETNRVSVDSNGDEANYLSWSPDISGDGRIVAFRSHASNLVPDDTNNKQDIFLHDRETGKSKLVSVDINGQEGNFHSHDPSLNHDGHVVAFVSEASNLVTDDTNQQPDIFVHDLSPYCDIQLNQSNYESGQNIIANVFQLANPFFDTAAIEWKAWFNVPGSAPLSILNIGADSSLLLTPGFNNDFAPIPLATVTMDDTIGIYAFNCRLIDPVTGFIISQDDNSFNVQ